MRGLRYLTQHVLPLVYDESLSYYENLCKVMHFIEVLTEDNEELANQFSDLKEYVDNFIDSIDVEEEVENKINEMVESGEFASILSGVINTYVIPEMYGAIGDGETDDTEALQECFQNARLIAIKNKYKITESVAINSNTHVIGSGSIINTSQTISSLVGEDVDNVIIEDVTFVGGDHLSGNVAYTGEICIIEGSNIKIDSASFISNNKSAGIFLDKVEHFSVKNCNFKDSGYSGVFCYGECYYGDISNNIIEVGYHRVYVNTYAIALSCTDRVDGAKKAHECKYVNVCNNLCYTETAYWEGLDTHSGDHIKFSGNTIIGFYDGISCTRGNDSTGAVMYPTNITIEGNNIVGNPTVDESRNGEYGISVAGGHGVQYSNISITNNTFRKVNNSNHNDNSFAIFLSRFYGCACSGNVFLKDVLHSICLDDVGRCNFSNNVVNGGGDLFVIKGGTHLTSLSFINNTIEQGRNMYVLDETTPPTMDSTMCRLGNSVNNGYWKDNSIAPTSNSSFVPDVIGNSSPAGSSYHPAGAIAYNRQVATGRPIGWICDGTTWHAFGTIS